MNQHTEFSTKWSEAAVNNTKKTQEEFSIFVEPGAAPATQRQFNLLHYYEFIGDIVKKNNYQKPLEIGCGRGTISLYLRKYLNLDVTLTDVSDKAVALAEKNFSHHHATGTIVKDNAENMQFSEGSFDVITSIGLAEHFEDYTKLFQDQFRVLAPGGTMISLNIPKKRSIQMLNSLYRKLFVKVENQKKDYYRNEDSMQDYVRTAKEAGFVDVEAIYVNSFPLFTPLGKTAETAITKLYNAIYKLRGLFMKYPFKGSRIFAQAHFLVAKKPE